MSDTRERARAYRQSSSWHAWSDGKVAAFAESEAALARKQERKQCAECDSGGQVLRRADRMKGNAMAEQLCMKCGEPEDHMNHHADYTLDGESWHNKDHDFYPGAAPAQTTEGGK
jgi:hypothetical protein